MRGRSTIGCLFAVLAVLLPAGCTAQVGVAGPLQVPEDGLQQCQAQCGTMGMQVGAVVAMANTIGCVCEPSGEVAEEQEHASALTGGMAAIVIQQRQQQQQQQAAQ